MLPGFSVGYTHEYDRTWNDEKFWSKQIEIEIDQILIL